MHDRLTLRDATAADAELLAALYNAAIQAGETMRDGQPRTEAAFRRVLDGLGDREACLLLEDDPDGSGQALTVVGWGVVRRYSDRPGYRFCGETFVYVRPDLRRRGYGTRLQQALVERCKAFGDHHLLGRVWGSNAASLAFHEASGYDVVGVQRDIGYLDGHWEDLVVLQRVLDDA